jgi:hypothetical protein
MPIQWYQHRDTFSNTRSTMETNEAINSNIFSQKCNTRLMYRFVIVLIVTTRLKCCQGEVSVGTRRFGAVKDYNYRNSWSSRMKKICAGCFKGQCKNHGTLYIHKSSWEINHSCWNMGRILVLSVFVTIVAVANQGAFGVSKQQLVYK